MKKAKQAKVPPPQTVVPKWSDSIAKFAAARRKTFSHDRRLTIGASEVGRCMRAGNARRSGVWQPDPNYATTNGFAVRGDIMEDAWTAPVVGFHVEAAGGKLLYAGQENQITLKADKIPLSATPDGLAVGVPRSFLAEWGVPDIATDAAVLEFKSLDDRFDKRKLPKFEHRAQLIAQMGMIRRGTEHKPLWGAVMYVDASDYFDAPWFPVEYTDDAFKGLLSRAKAMIGAKHPNLLPPEGKLDGGRECRTCEFAQQCLGFLPWLAKGDAAVKDKKLAKAIKVLGGQIIDKEAEIDAARKSLAVTEMRMYEALSKAKTRFVKLDGVTVVTKTTKPQNRYDTKAMAARLKELGDDPEKYKAPTKPGASLTVEMA